jgi:hypothetical protein
MKTDLTHLIERLEVFEERLSIRLNALYAFRFSSGGWVTVNGELHPMNGDSLKADVDLVLDVYDRSGLLVGSNSRHFRRAHFFGFETFSMGVLRAGNECAVSKIRLYPKALATAHVQWWRHSK